MFFKNLKVYKITEQLGLATAKLEAALADLLMVNQLREVIKAVGESVMPVMKS